MPRSASSSRSFEPGRLIAPLIATLRHQTLPAAEREVIFVDDSSRDGTGERLDGALHWVQRPDRQNASRRHSPPTPTSTRCARWSRWSTSAPSRGRSATATTATGTEARFSCGSGGARTRSTRRWSTRRPERIEDCFPPRLDEALVFNLRLRAALVQHDDRGGLEALAEFARGSRRGSPARCGAILDGGDRVSHHGGRGRRRAALAAPARPRRGRLRGPAARRTATAPCSSRIGTSTRS